jgi:hypothetical protein
MLVPGNRLSELAKESSMSVQPPLVSILRAVALFIAIFWLTTGACANREVNPEAGAVGHANAGVVETANKVLAALES